MLKTLASVLIATSLVAGGAAMAATPASSGAGIHKQDMKDKPSKHHKKEKSGGTQ